MPVEGTLADKQAPDGAFFIDQSLCIKCGACTEVQPAAIRVVDAYSVAVGAAAD